MHIYIQKRFYYFIPKTYNYNTKKKLVRIIDPYHSDKIDYIDSYILDCKNSNLYGYNFVKLYLSNYKKS